MPHTGSRSEDLVDIVASAVSLTLSGQVSEARDLLAAECEAPCATSPRGSLSPRLQVAVFRRDKFTCRYCGQRTLFVPVLRVLSAIAPDEFPYHPNWKMSECHIAYWKCGTSIDHVVPVARGGSASAVNNLITACYMCNSIKQNWLVEELRWQTHPVDSDHWDGLSATLPQLCEIAQLTKSPYFARWLRAIA